jgi:low affinity Fe/Cu permease
LRASRSLQSQANRNQSQSPSLASIGRATIAKAQNIPVEEARGQVQRYEEQYRRGVEDAKQEATQAASVAAAPSRAVRCSRPSRCCWAQWPHGSAAGWAQWIRRTRLQCPACASNDSGAGPSGPVRDSMWQRFRHGMTLLGVMSARPAAFVVFAGYAVCWVVFDRPSLDWHALATLATWLMTLVIQRAEHRDTQAIQAKLDELLRANRNARNELTRIDDEEPERIEQYRAQERGLD